MHADSPAETLLITSPCSVLAIGAVHHDLADHVIEHSLHRCSDVFLQSNEWTGRQSFGGRSLHHIGVAPNPYEEAMMIIGKTLAKFDDDQLIPAYGFGDGEKNKKHV